MPAPAAPPRTFTRISRDGPSGCWPATPKLRGRDADRMVAILLMEDAQPAGVGQAASDRSTRRLFERLVALGAVRELTGRPTFRLYGL